MGLDVFDAVVALGVHAVRLRHDLEAVEVGISCLEMEADVRRSEPDARTRAAMAAAG